MSTDLAIPQDPAALDRVQDPAAVMVALVDQARTMLAQAQGMEGLADVIEWKSRAEAIRVYTQQKDMGHEAELSAAEIVRRAERRIGQLIREGQEAGEIRRRGQREDRESTHDLPSPTDFARPSDLRGNGEGIYQMTDGVSDEVFDEAIEEAKEEGNLFRRELIEGAGLVAQRYNGDLDDEALKAKLVALRGGANALLTKAGRIRAVTDETLGQCVAAALVEVANTGRGGKKLPAWWKQ